jgi:glycosyltransferase involved in cell wall biosynthesis
VIVVDDGSGDATAALAEAAGATVLRQAQNGGKGQALRTGLDYVRGLQPRAVVLLDGDGQHNPEEIPQVLFPVLAGEADIVVGSRFLATRSQIPWWRRIGQHGLNWATTLGSGVSSSDSQSGFRALSATAIERLMVRGNGFSVESEMQFAAKEHGLLMHEVPITCLYVEPPKRNPVVHGLQVLDGVLKMIGQMRPLLFFGIPSLLLLCTGVLLGNTVIELYRYTRQLAVGYALITVLLVVIGVVGLSAGIILHSVRALLLDLLGRSR